MDQGNIAEYDSPAHLLENEASYFTRLVKENGPDFEHKMRYLANNKHIDIDQVESPTQKKAIENDS